MGIVEKAELFARRAHEGQYRKYTGEDYVCHPINVMRIVKTVDPVDVMLAAALLHDVVEDTSVTSAEILRKFGGVVARLVDELTNIAIATDGNRAERVRINAEHLAKASPEAHTIKLADILDNTGSIVEHDPRFAVVYLKENLALLPMLNRGDSFLFARVDNQLTDSLALL